MDFRGTIDRWEESSIEPQGGEGNLSEGLHC